MKYLFFQCPHGHFFRGGGCPYDGWTHPEISSVEKVFDFHAGNMTITGVVELISDDRLRQAVIIVEATCFDKDMDGFQLSTTCARQKCVKWPTA